MEKNQQNNLPEYIDRRSLVRQFIPTFTHGGDEHAIFVNILDSGYGLNCSNICHPYFWHDEWDACPLCCAPVVDGAVLHREDQ